MRLFARIYQKIMKIAIKMMRFPTPKTYKGISNVLEIIKEEKLNKILIVTDKFLVSSKLVNLLTDILDENKIDYAMFDSVEPDPTTITIYKGRDFYKENKCDSIIAFGGGSSMDTAKCIGLLITNKHQDLSKYKKVLSVKKKLPTLICVPTTCGTGSEATVAAVVRDVEKNEKYAISDPHLIPKYAIFEVKVLENLPKHILSATLMDALTHAIESYISTETTKFTRKCALDAIKLIYENAHDAYDRNDLKAKENLFHASYLAGVAFTRTYVGYVHAVAHAMGAMYHLPHGYLCAILLPIFLDRYFKKITKKLSRICSYIGFRDLSEDKHENARNFIQYIKDMNANFAIPAKIKELKLDDVTEIVRKAQKETIPSYPVPIIFSNHDLMRILLEDVKGD